MDLVALREVLESYLEGTMPNFEIGVSSTGEVIIATGLMEDEDGELIEMELEDLDDELISDDESLDALEEEEMDL